MKKQTFVNIMITASILFTASCSKEDTSTGGGSSSGSNNCSSNYLPYRAGTKVEAKDASGNSSSFTIKKDTTINGILYHEIENQGASSTVRSFMGLDNSKNVWIKTSGGDPLGGGAFSVASEYIMLNPSKAVGETWNYKTTVNVSGFNLEYIYDMKILEKNISATVDGKSYSNGIRFSIDTKFVMQGISTPSPTLEYVFLCGLGIYTSKQNGQIMSTTTKYTY